MNWRRLSSWSLGILLAATSTLAAAEPTVRNLDVRGLRIGGKTTLTVDGANLEPAPRLLLPWPAAKVEAQAGATAVRAVFDVELPADVVAGTYQIRVATDEGVSAPVIIGVDHLPQAAFTPLVTAIPVALHGAIGGGTLETKIPGTGGEELTIEVE